MRQKNSYERKNEIIDASEVLFYSKGYEKCTINDILKKVGIAKGTFYHYFNSKEEVLDAVVDRTITLMKERIKKKISNHLLNHDEKLMNVFLAMRVDDIVDDNKLSDIHMSDNALLHQKMLSKMIESITPILVSIVEEGVKEKVWDCIFPLEYMQIFLASSLILTDDGFIKTEKQSQHKIMLALVTVLEKMLGRRESVFVEMFLENWYSSNMKNP